MEKRKTKWKKAAAYVLMAAMSLQSSFLAAAETVSAEEMELQELLELTSPEFETGEESASYARLKIGDWLDYGDYGIERADIPGTTCLFYITTKDENEEVINDTQLAYCIQSYFLTPLPGEHTVDMTDHVLSVNGGKNVHRALYYGYGGAGYDAAEFEEFLSRTNPEYSENVYSYLSDNEKGELAYILTHAAASYAYFTDGTDFERFLELQFEIKYGEGWESELTNFIKTDVAKAEAAAGDLNLFGSTYGMNGVGITLSKAWYDVICSKKEPDLSVTEGDDGYTFNGNEKNTELKLEFAVPEGWECEITRANGTTEDAASGERVTVYPTEGFAFTYVSEHVSTEQGGITDAQVTVDGTLAGAENENWNLVVLETNKGTNATVSKRQQDIAAVSRIDAGKTELDFVVEAQNGSIALKVTDNEGNPIKNAVFGVYYDSECGIPVQQDGENVVTATDDSGEAYLEYVINQRLEENGGSLYVKQEKTPTGYTAHEEIYCMADGQSVEITNAHEAVAVRGSVSWNVPEGTELPASVTVMLQQDGETIDAKTVGEAEDWSYEWDDLQKYRGAGTDHAAEHAYTVAAEPIEGYETAVDGNDLVNTITGTVRVEGQAVWYDSEDADGLRPERVTVELSRGDEIIDSAEISAENDWQYQFGDLEMYSQDGRERYEYSIGIQNPEEYIIEIEEGQITAIHAASVEPVLQIAVELAGREPAKGEFQFDLVQVTDVTGRTEAEGGISASTVNDAEGKAVFEDISITEPGTYYFRISGNTAQPEGAVESEPVIYIVQVDAEAGGAHGDQLEAEVTYLDEEGNELAPEEVQIAAAYRASGEAVIDGIAVILGNGSLTEGQFTAELKDEEGKVLQTKANDSNGIITFDAISYTEEDIGNEFVYTISEVNSGESGIAYDDTVYTITVKVEDSETGDGTLKITRAGEAVTFTNEFVMPETETESESPETSETKTAAGTGAAVEAAAKAQGESGSRHIVIVVSAAVLLIILILLFIKRTRKK